MSQNSQNSPSSLSPIAAVVISKDPTATVVAQERELLTQYASSQDAADYKVKPPRPCVGCGQPAHGPVNELIACLTTHLASSRQKTAQVQRELEALQERAHIGVTREAFEDNRRGSIDFENKRGKNKKGGGP
jgi:hypothetical protein